MEAMMEVDRAGSEQTSPEVTGSELSTPKDDFQTRRDAETKMRKHYCTPVVSMHRHQGNVRPERFDAEVEDVIRFIEHIQGRLSRRKRDKETLTRFHSLKIPAMDIARYAQRIAHFAECSPQCFTLALVYIDRLVRSDRSIDITAFTIHRLLIAAVVVAVKYLDDIYHLNPVYGRIGGISSSEINTLESEFVFRLRFDLFVSRATYRAYRRELVKFRRSRSRSSGYKNYPCRSPVLSSCSGA